MSDNATYLLNELDKNLPNGTVLKSKNDIRISQTSTQTNVSTSGNLRGIESLADDDTGILINPDLKLPKKFKTRSFTSSDGTVSITNPKGIAGNPTFSIVPNSSVQKVNLGIQNGVDTQSLLSASSINFNGKSGMSVGCSTGSSGHNIAISSIEIPGYKNLDTTVADNAADTFVMTSSVDGSVATIQFGNAYGEVPTDAAYFQYNGTSVEQQIPDTYVESIKGVLTEAAADVLDLTVAPMELDEFSSPGDDVVMGISFNTTDAVADQYISWDTDKGAWTTLEAAGVKSVGMSVGNSLDQLFSLVSSSPLTTSGTFSFAYNNTPLIEVYKTARWNDANNRFEWSNFASEIEFTIDASMNQVLTVSNPSITYTGNANLSLFSTSGGKTIIFDGTKFALIDFGAGDVTSVSAVGDNKISQTGATPVNSGAASFIVGIDQVGATTGQFLVAPTNLLTWGDPTTYTTEMPYVVSQGYVQLINTDGSGANQRYLAAQITFNIGSDAITRYRTFAMGASRQVGHNPAQQTVVTQYPAKSGNNLLLDIFTRGTINDLNTYVQYVIVKLPA